MILLEVLEPENVWNFNFDPNLEIVQVSSVSSSKSFYSSIFI